MISYCMRCGREITNFDVDMSLNTSIGWLHRKCLAEILREYEVLKPIYDAGIEKARKVVEKFIKKRKGDIDFSKLMMVLRQNVDWITAGMVEKIILENNDYDIIEIEE